MTSGVNVQNIIVNKKIFKYDISNLIRIRPQLYLIFKGKINKKYKQLIFKNHKEIKYIHNISDYSKGLAKGTQLFLTSFFNFGYYSEKIVEKTLKELGIISFDSKIIYAHAICPILSLVDVNKINELTKKSDFLINFIDTENFTRAIEQAIIYKK